MDQSVEYKRAIAKVAFIVLLLAVMSAPQLLSEDPGPGFAQLRALFQAIPLTVWLGIGAVALVGLIVASAVRSIRAHARSSRAASSAIQQMSIQKAVDPANGGNGLISDTFPLTLPWLGVAGWVEVPTPGMECLTIDGKRVIRKTSLHISPMQWFGKPSSARRVLLAPEPQVIPTVEALSADKWSTRIDASITFRVRDPLSVLSKKPLDDLNHLAQGVIGEHIRSHAHEDLLGDTGPLRRALEARLRESPVLQGLEIIEVPIKVAGDERVIETRRQETIEHTKQDLVKMLNENLLTEKEFEIKMQQMEAELREWEKQREHARQMEMRSLEAQMLTLQETIGAIAKIAASGIDPTGAMKEIRQLVAPTESWEVEDLPPAELPAESLIAKERRMLEEKRPELGITEIDIEPNSSEPEHPGNARIVFPDYTLMIDCPDDYPQTAPSVLVQPNEGEKFPVNIPWNADSHLTEIVASALMQVPFELESRAEKEE